MLAAANAEEDDKPKRIAVVALSDGLVAAIETSLAPWGVELFRAEETTLGAVMPSTAEAAREVANRLDAQSIVWLSQDDSGTAIWVYDGATDRVTARALPTPPPYDEPTAAAIALSVKTLLRHSFVAPKKERFGATPEVVAEVPIPPPTPPRFVVGLAATGRFRADIPIEARLAIDLEAKLLGRFAALARLRVGTGRQVLNDPLASQLGSFGLAVGPAFTLVSNPRFAAIAWAGPAVEVAQLSVTQPEARTISRFNPSFDLGVVATLRLAPRVHVQALGGSSALLRRQVYEVGDMTVLKMPRFEFEAGLGLRLLL